MPRKKRTGKEVDQGHKKAKSSKSLENKKPVYDRQILWRGYIVFGLVNIPVVLYSAEKSAQEIHFKLLAKKNLAGIKYLRINEKTGKEVEWHDIVKGYEYEPGSYVVLTEDDFNEVAQENLKTIEIEDFVDLDSLGTIYFEKPYYILPDKRGDKGYVLLRETLKKTNKIGIARIIIRTHQYLAAVIPSDNALIVNLLRYPQEIKNFSEVDFPSNSIDAYKISKKEFDIAKQLVETMSVKWDPTRYSNEYRKALLKLIEDKIALGGKKAIAHVKEVDIKQTNVIDFMELLKKSIHRKKSLHAEKPVKKKPKGK